jgi:hypothetical protein
LAAEYLAKKHNLQIGRETLWQAMMIAGLWRGRRQRVEAVEGEFVPWSNKCICACCLAQSSESIRQTIATMKATIAQLQDQLAALEV